MTMAIKAVWQECGQSLWLDYIRRHLLQSGELARLVREDGIRGVTSNPSIFEKAIAGSTDYDDAIRRLEGRRDQTASALYEQLAISDIQQAADILRPLFEESARGDGYVSMEVSPYLARDTQGTIDEAIRLWKRVGRDNLLIKVPATPEGIPAIAELIGQGINVNVTLLFSRSVCLRVAEAYLDGLELFAKRGGELARIASVASVFVSRLDVLVGPVLEGRLRTAPSIEQDRLRSLVGKVAIANAKLVYQDWKERLNGPRWQALAERGAHPQRLLWASTGTKDPRLSDVLYVESLIGPNTVNTVPPATLNAFREHGQAKNRLEEDLDDAKRVLAALEQLGISIDALTSSLLDEGVKSFSASFDALMSAIEKKRDGVLKSAIDRISYRLPPALDQAVKKTLQEWRETGKIRRLWAKDASLWTGHDENRWLDWLTVADSGFAEEIQFPFKHAVVLGMGGSSLCPDVLSRTFGRVEGRPELLILDSTDPAQIQAIAARVDLSKTLFIVSSKSGTTLEPNILKDYFYQRVQEVVGESQVGSHFIAITDPGSELEKVADRQKFARVFPGVPGIGGRYSALSNFGMVPAAVMGIDVPQFLRRTEVMVHACASCVPPEENPGVLLGAVLGTLARSGRDKVTLVASPGIEPLGAWLEQLLAESTGKKGHGIVPVDRETLGAPDVYGADRLFAYLRLDEAPSAEQDAAVALLEKAGQPVVRIALGQESDLGQEFFRWEMAIAVAGAIIGIDPFNQPDVESSKVAARKLTLAYEKSGTLPRESPFFEEGAIKLFADEKNQLAIQQVAGLDRTLQGYVKAHLSRLGPGDYFALLAYLERNDVNDCQLQRTRLTVRDARRVATCIGFGPRYLHSTGQAYKGGPNSGVFLQLTCDDSPDLPVPGHRFSFGVVKAAQARGDFHVLAQRDRRALRLHLGSDIGGGLNLLHQAVVQALAGEP